MVEQEAAQVVGGGRRFGALREGRSGDQRDSGEGGEKDWGEAKGAHRPYVGM